MKLAGQAFAAISDPARYAALTRAEKTAALNALSTFVHEELHGVSRSTEKAYVGVGMGIEEAATEILARKVVRELARDPEGLALPVRQEDGRYGAGGKQGEAAYYGAYNKAISGLLAVVGREAGHEGVQQRVERAFLKIRAPEAGDSRWVGETDQIREFVAALDGVDDEQRGKIRVALTGWRWTQGEQ